MRRGVFIIFLIFMFSPYFLGAQNAALNTGKWAKIAVSKQGIYQITGAQLKTLGFPLPIRSTQLQLFNYNLAQLSEKVNASISTDLTENAIQVLDGGDNQIDEKDYILFYAQGAVCWKQDASKFTPTHYKNASNDSIFYFVTMGSNGKRISTLDKLNASAQMVDQYDERWLIEVDSISLLNSGKLLLGPAMGQGLGKQAKLSYPININGLVLSSPMKLVSSYVATTYQNAANFNFSINDNAIKTTAVAPVSGLLYDESANIVTDSFSYSLNTNTNLSSPASVNISFQADNVAAAGWVDYIELSAKRKLGFWGTSSFGFRNVSTAVKGNILQYQMQNGDISTEVWEVTNPASPRKIVTDFSSNGLISFQYQADTLHEFFAVKQQSYEIPILLGSMTNQNLVGMNVPDYIIVAPSNYLNAAKKLQNYHATANGLKTELVNVNEIFNEFSGGQPSAIGIRNFIKYLLNKSVTNKVAAPRYLLLFGIANYNTRNYNSATEIPVFESAASTGVLTSYPSDDFYSILNDNDDINNYTEIKNLAIATGRLPVRNSAEADTVVEKIINYQKNSSGGAWKNNITWVADDGDYNLHLQDAEAISNHLQEKAPKWNQKKIYLDFYAATKNIAGNTYPLVNSEIVQTINEGSLILNYTGHGNYARLAEEAVMSQSDVLQWNNPGKLPLMITASCDFAPYDQPQLSPFGFDALMKNSKGVIGLVAASRLVFAYSNKQINDHFVQQLLVPDSLGRFPTLGEALQKAKIQAWSAAEDHMNAFKFSLLGDPAMRLSTSKYEIGITHLNQKPFTGKDTLLAGNKYTIKGLVNNKGISQNDFNGLLDFVLFDAATNKKTLANAGSSIVTSVSTQENILFKGKVSVTKGNFTVDFLLPKEVSLQKNLKMQITAYNELSDAMGVYDKLIALDAGGILWNDNQGPALKIFLNDSNFMDGGWAAPRSNLFLSLADSGGIQTSGNALGHDMVLTIDEDYKNAIVLNNYFVADLDSYQKGKLMYALPLLAEGPHKIMVKVWDLLGNSTTKIIHFEVPKSDNLTVKNLYNYPNPFQHFTQFSFEHNKLGQSLEINLSLYDNMGNLLFTKPLNGTYKANRVVAGWDGAGTGSALLQAGIYYYRLIINDGVVTRFLTNKLVKY
ncbi:MAG: T9SS C-terminal target domain-containing protein [Sediminibacterium sp.]|nr:MAG: T9SS C-terminal target domain-containing protein [Sediminibacterium sp.]